MTLVELKNLVLANGYRVSASSYEDDRFVYASSVEVYPDSYGHPRFAVQFCKVLKKLHTQGK